MPLRATVIPVTPFAQNCSVVWDDATGRGAVIDPGGDLDRVLAAAEEEGVTLEKILLTHAHIDHAGATAELARLRGLPIEGPHPGDRFWIEQLPQQGAMFGLGKSESFEPTRWLGHGDTVTVGNLPLEVLHCPGHTPGHVVFFDRGARVAFVGDVLFAGSIGRTDFPGGDYATLIRAIRENLFPLGDDVRFVPGHGPMSTFGEERRTNPFVGDRAVGSNG
ncbi:MAG: MBL fold metallo-hydrolase [Steroidobacteraceae bacterium]|jgi:glyoxylase-like metal-dependent hydrolase (beta-lactamase superfamily II)|nr:MBL fold metallo-hydrolase [Steroidobacteraceae bacterium]